MWTLLHFPLCPASRTVRLALYEGGVEAGLSEIKPWAPGRSFLNLNPAGTLPVLTSEGLAICGVYPIIEYLTENPVRAGAAPPRSTYWPAKPADRAEARRVADWFWRKFDNEVTQYLLEEKVYKPMSRGRIAPDLNTIRAGRSNLRYHLSYVSFLSEQRKWLAGDHPSVADLAAAAQLSVVDYLGEVPWAEFPEAKDWYARLKSRPAFRPLLAERVPGFTPPENYADLDF
jgi:glutathione S-transferase